MIKNLAINKNIVFLLVVICLIYFSENIETFVLDFKSHLKSLKKEDNIDFKGECALFFLLWQSFLSIPCLRQFSLPAYQS